MHSSLPHQTEGRPPDQTPPELVELAEDYVLEGELGRGGTAVVYRARERVLGRVVAIKVIRGRYVDDEEVVARLEREARLVARLDHPNVVSLLGVRRLRVGSLALVMRYVRGHTLRQELQQRGALPLARARAVLDDVGRALAAAHAHGIVHRDVKPENIHVEHGASRSLLADFGSATPLRGDLHLTVAGMAIGTPGYMAPELIDGAPATPSSDVYGLGLVAWEMLAGRVPWEGDSLFAILSFRKQGELADLHSIRPDVPPSVAEAVSGALHADPAERWPDVHHFQDALSRPAPRRWLLRTARRHSEARTAQGNSGPGIPAAGEAATGCKTVRLTIPGSPSNDDPGAQPSTATDRDQTERQRPPEEADGRSPPIPPRLPPGPDSAVGGRSPAAPHPSEAIFAADDAPPDEVLETAPAWGGGRRRSAMLVAALLVVLVLGAGALLRLGIPDGDATPPLHAGGDQPRSVTVAMGAATSGDPPPAVAPSRPAAGDTLVATGILERAGDVEREGSPPAGNPIDAHTTDSGAAATGANRSGAPVGADMRVTRRATRGIGTQSGGSPPVVPSTSGGQAAGAATAPAAVPAEGSAASGSGPAAGGVRPPTAAGAAGLVLGGMQSCTLSSDGRPTCWGSADGGSPSAPPRAARFTSLAAGLTHDCGLTTDGRTLCWGANDSGQLGDGTSAARSGAVAVRGAEGHVAVALGESSTCALTRSGRIECWGANGSGQLGTGDGEPHLVPTAVAGDTRFTAITAGWRHYCALATNRQAYCWGDNSAGQLGDGTTDGHGAPTAVNSSLRFRALAAGRAFTCGITTTGAIYCWGSNDAGQLGTGSRLGAPTPRPVRASGTASAIVAGSAHACALLTDGSVECWGQNRYGQLGDGTWLDRGTPVRARGMSAITMIAASGAHSCARDSQDQLYCWGYNVFGQVGDGTRQNRQLPVAISPDR